MAWKDGVAPNAPQNLRYERLAGTGTMALKWDVPFRAGDGDTASRYVVYRFDHPAIQPQELDDASKIVAIAGAAFSMPKPPASPGPHYYVVTALDRNSNESLHSPAVMVLPPATPVLLLPAAVRSWRCQV
jgi:hypothetical protein